MPSIGEILFSRLSKESREEITKKAETARERKTRAVLVNGSLVGPDGLPVRLDEPVSPEEILAKRILKGE